MKRIAVLALLLSLCAATVLGQDLSSVAARLGYPQLIVYNGKLVTIDDPGVNENLGRVVQAMAIRDGKILAVGTNTEVRSLAGPQTKQIDLRGRTVLPGLIMTHEHPNDWMFEDQAAWENALPMENDKWMLHFLDAAPADQAYKNFWSTLREMAAKAKPGQWLILEFNRSTNLAWGEDTMDFLYGPKAAISKAGLDNAVPNNPVIIRSGGAMGTLNSKALEEIKKAYPDFKEFAPSGTLPLGISGEAERFMENPVGIVTRNMFPELVLKGNYVEEAKLLKDSLSLWAAYGMTAFASAPYDSVTFQAFGYLDSLGELPERYAWGYIGPDFSERTLRTISGLLGKGSDYMWNVGAWPETGGPCTTIDAPPEIKKKERCSFAPGSPAREVVNRIIRVGGRIATMHTDGDKDIGWLLDSIEEESQKAGFTLDDIRAKRQSFDHMDGAPRPDQIPRIKKLGMVLSGQNWYLLEKGEITGTYGYARAYGEKYTCWVVPRKSLVNAGIMAGFEVDKPVPWLIFQRVLDGMTRYNTRDKKVYCPEERTDRNIQLKAMTAWGAYYMLREKQLGSLEPGKFADFIVLDRDFLTVPDQEIPNLHVLMTVVGGKTVHLMPSLAQEIGMQPVGPVTWKTISTPYLADAAKKLSASGGVTPQRMVP